MALVTKQKALLHIYAAAADLPDPIYRRILAEASGCVSAADREFSQSGFDLAMAKLESVLFDRVHRGLVPNPIGRVRWIGREDYWRQRLPASGYINTRQHHRIVDLWETLIGRLPLEQRTTSYFAGIVRHATGKTDLGVLALTSAQAGMVIDALADRLRHTEELTFP